YYDSPERAALNPPPTDYLDEVVTLMMDAAPSPIAAP
ncbi:MAG: hypothetical protein QOH73_1016, partial [Gaiellaceae bacterium]|nr:hypothetical protein [Gaiellaceae bacterium]